MKRILFFFWYEQKEDEENSDIGIHTYIFQLKLIFYEVLTIRKYLE